MPRREGGGEEEGGGKGKGGTGGGCSGGPINFFIRINKSDMCHPSQKPEPKIQFVSAKS